MVDGQNLDQGLKQISYNDLYLQCLYYFKDRPIKAGLPDGIATFDQTNDQIFFIFLWCCLRVTFNDTNWFNTKHVPVSATDK